MKVSPDIHLPPPGRDYRLDVLRGIANWAIFLDHIPNNVVRWVTTRNYGFFDAADLFIFISGWTVAFVYGRMMMSRGYIIAATRIGKRAWQIYVAHLVLFVMYIAEVGYLAKTYKDPELLNEFNVAGFMRDPAETLYQGLILAFKPVNMDVLPLYIVLMFFFPAVLWALLRKPDWTLFGSFVLYIAARHFGWNLPAYPSGSWYFNPFTWQFLFVIGAWFALGGTHRTMPVAKSRWLAIFGTAYLLFALFVTLGGRFFDMANILPHWLYVAFIPNDKTNLDPSRIVHFIIGTFFIIRYVPRDWAGFQRPIFQPMIRCGQQSLEVFCFGIFLAGAAHIILVEVSHAIWMQILVSVGGISLMTLLAYYRSWSKKLDKPASKTVPVTSAKPGTA
jgi:hypothetical protein